MRLHQAIEEFLDFQGKEYIQSYLSRTHQKAKIYQPLTEQMQETGIPRTGASVIVKPRSSGRITKLKITVNAPRTCACYEKLD